MADGNAMDPLEWNVTVEFDEKVWRARIDDWHSTAPWPWGIAEIRPLGSWLEATLTDFEYLHASAVGFFDTVSNAKQAIEATLDAMRTTAAVVCIDDRGIPRVIRVTLHVRSTGATLVNHTLPNKS